MRDNYLEAQYTPEDFINYYTKHHDISIKEIGVAPFVILSWGRKTVQLLANKVDAKTSPYWMHNHLYLFYNGIIQNNPVSFVQAPVGAPGTIMLMEEMIACGARSFIGLGWTGSLQKCAPVGTMLIPIECISEEGTSKHYKCNSISYSPDDQLFKCLHSSVMEEDVKVKTGLQWTTDAPYRELKSKIEFYKQRGVLGVDMETSAMYALGRLRKVQVCNLLIVSDELHTCWQPEFKSTKVQKMTEIAMSVVLKCAEKLLSNH